VALLYRLDAIERSAVSAGITGGDRENVIGFGGTNAVVLRRLRNVER